MRPYIKIDIYRPIREANAAFGARGLQLSGSVIVVGLFLSAIMWIVRTKLHQHAATLEWLVTLSLSPVLFGLADVIVISRFLALREGGGTESVGIARVLGYRGLTGTLAGYIGRLLGWFSVSALIVISMWLLKAFLAAMVRAMYGLPRSGPHRMSGWESFIWLQVVYLVWWVWMSRYQLALPFLAISEGSRLNLLKESAVRSRDFRWTLTGIALTQLLCEGLVPATLLYALRQHYGLYHPLSIGFGIASTVFSAIAVCWFLLVKTGVALQVFGRVPPATPVELHIAV